MQQQHVFLIVLLSLTAMYLNLVQCFVPRIAEKDLELVENVIDLGKVSVTLSHEDILRRGLIQSIVKYYAEKSNNRVNSSRLESYYRSLKNLYVDLNGPNNGMNRNINLELLLATVLEPSVAFVDFDPNTRDLPYAHFDDETLIRSNEHVINLTSKVVQHLSSKEYRQAQVLSAKVLHTIHDFYSHSNWVEMGLSEINKLIGTPDFNKQPIIDSKEIACNNNCTLVTKKCTFDLNILISFLKKIDAISTTDIRCPIQYYVCQDNIVIKDKLLSGYVGDRKPKVGMKCSHGGILDSSSSVEAKGGINKDSGFSMISPHANLHLRAADLAIKHTAYYFDIIREKLGDETFVKFLDLDQVSFKSSTSSSFSIHKCFFQNIALFLSLTAFCIYTSLVFF
jgi:hypothetical protein